jgi:DNA-binding beta-propeller fold protein YncE
MDANGNLLISEYGNDRIRHINLTTNIITTLVGNGMEGFSGDNGDPLEAQINDPLGIAVDPYGNLFISDRGNYRVRKATP